MEHLPWFKLLQFGRETCPSKQLIRSFESGESDLVCVWQVPLHRITYTDLTWPLSLECVKTMILRKSTLSQEDTYEPTLHHKQGQAHN
jgi:hypothetical protein